MKLKRPATPLDWFAVLAPTGYVIGLVWELVAYGLPTEHAGLIAWLVGGLAAFSVRTWRRWPRLLADWVPILALLVAYDFARGDASVGLLDAHFRAQIDFDKLIAGGTVPTVWLQDHFYRGPGASPAPWDYAAWAVYITHFWLPWLMLAVLWRRSHDRFRQLRDRLVTLTVAGCAIYALYPAAPPWLSATPPVHRIIGPMWEHVGLKVAAPLFESGSGLVNVVAAVPSLHAAFPCLLMLFFWPTAGPALRALLATYTFAMGLTLVYSGEHYVFDILAGWALAASVMLVFVLVPRAWAVARQRVRPEPQPQAETARP